MPGAPHPPLLPPPRHRPHPRRPLAQHGLAHAAPASALPAAAVRAGPSPHAAAAAGAGLRALLAPPPSRASSPLTGFTAPSPSRGMAGPSAAGSTIRDGLIASAVRRPAGPSEPASALDAPGLPLPAPSRPANPMPPLSSTHIGLDSPNPCPAGLHEPGPSPGPPPFPALLAPIPSSTSAAISRSIPRQDTCSSLPAFVMSTAVAHCCPSAARSVLTDPHASPRSASLASKEYTHGPVVVLSPPAGSRCRTTAIHNYALLLALVMQGPPPATDKHNGQRVEVPKLCHNERCLHPAHLIWGCHQSNAHAHTAASEEALHRWPHRVGPMVAPAAAAADAVRE